MAKRLSQKTPDVAIVLCGQAGQGIQTVEKFLTKVFKSAGYNVFATKEYMSRVRGGMNSTLIRICAKPVQSAVDRVDILLPLDRGSVTHLKKRISAQTLIVGEEKICADEISQKYDFLNVPFSRIAEDIGGSIYSNTVAAGAVVGLFTLSLDEAQKSLSDFFAGKSQEIIDKNCEALRRGYDIANGKSKNRINKCKPAAASESGKQMLINGAEAIGLGAIAGGCNFVSSYPMSPSTGVLTFMAQHAKDFGIIVEQAEDEICAINMAIGAWYAGARGLVTTSGGGFALMSEGLSLAGMLESPLVVHLAQRPGPATGLPTRTEQGDLELALYSGHGEFPRVIYAPSTLEEAFTLAGMAFETADKFQVPVIILTDQFLMDSYYNTTVFEKSGIVAKKHFIRTAKNYVRHELTADGMSSRGIAGFGDGLVCVDSDEHDESGHITENLELRVRMVEKRLKKYETMKPQNIPSAIIGPDDARNIIICWGSTFNAVDEAVHSLGRKDTAVMHFAQVWPLHEESLKPLKTASKLIVVEGNATGQFAKLLRLYGDVEANHQILRYDGLPFSSDHLTEKLKKIL